MKRLVLSALMLSAFSVGAHAQNDFDKQVDAYQKKIDNEVLHTPLGAYANMAEAFGKFDLLLGILPKGQTADLTGLADANIVQAEIEKQVAELLNDPETGKATCEQVKDVANEIYNNRYSKFLEGKRTEMLIKAKNNLVDAVSLYSQVTCEELKK